jgi:hypothetical protein
MIESSSKSITKLDICECHTKHDTLLHGLDVVRALFLLRITSSG